MFVQRGVTIVDAGDRDGDRDRCRVGGHRWGLGVTIVTGGDCHVVDASGGVVIVVAGGCRWWWWVALSSSGHDDMLVVGWWPRCWVLSLVAVVIALVLAIAVVVIVWSTMLVAVVASTMLVVAGVVAIIRR